MTAIETLSEGLMSEEKETGGRFWSPTFMQIAAVLLAAALGSGGAASWNQSELRLLFEQHVESCDGQFMRIREDITELRNQSIGSHNFQNIQIIADAIERIDPDASSDWTADGKPRVGTIQDLLRVDGYRYIEVNASLRDMAWGLSRMAR